MPIPSSERVIFDPNPIVEAGWQFVVPTVLRLEEESPYQLQEAIQDDYPHVKARISDVEGRTEKLKTYEFISRDKFWRFTVCADYIHLATTDYETRDKFRDRLEPLLEAFCDVYDCSLTVAMFLNYRDVIDRERLTLKDRQWAELLNPTFAGELATPNLDDSEILELNRSVTLDLQGGLGEAQLRHGLHQLDDGRRVYVIDSFLGEEREQTFEKALDRLDAYHDRGGELFRWIISDELNTVLRGGET